RRYGSRCMPASSPCPYSTATGWTRSPISSCTNMLRCWAWPRPLAHATFHGIRPSPRTAFRTRWNGCCNDRLGSPIQNDLAAIAALHSLKAGDVVADRQAVGDHLANVETAFQHGEHLVPGFKHL